MSLFDSVISYLKKKEKGDGPTTPEGACPHCWGYQEYDSKVRKIVDDHQINVSSGREKYAFIQDFVVNHVDGIKLRNTLDSNECPRCHRKY